MAVITLTGLRGSGVREIGREVATLLQMDYVDRLILSQAASRLGLPLEKVAQRDQRVAPLSERLSRLVQNILEKSAVAGAADDPFLGATGASILLSRSYAEAAQPPLTRSQELDDTRFLEVTTAVIRELAEKGNVVIIGRGSQAILKDYPGALHIGLVASKQFRVAHVMEEEKLGREQAERMVAHSDHNYMAFFKKLFKGRLDDLSLYHLVLNTERLPFAEAARIIASIARGWQRA